MRRKRLFRRLFLVYLTITLLSLLAIGLLATRTVRSFYYDQTTAELENIANLVREHVSGQFLSLSISELDSVCIHLGQLTTTRITFIRSDGVVLGDADEDPRKMENRSDRPEFKRAMAGRAGVSIRFSPTIGDQRMYLAIPVDEAGEIVGVARVSLSLEALSAALKTVYVWIVLGGLIIAVFAGIGSFFVARRFSRPLEQIKEGALRFASGDLNTKLVIPDFAELGDLADTLNQTAVQLRDRIDTVTRQRNELDAVLESMVEGLLAIDLDERIVRLNRAGSRLLRVDSNDVRGRTIQETIISPDFQGFVAKVLRERRHLEDEIRLQDGRLVLQVSGTVFRDATGADLGVLIVMNDVTQLRKLENLRRDFVANVSHELRTPITSIKGFVETLRDGAIHSPEDASRFLDIIAKHADRLNAIIEDLLRLSKIERDAETDRITLEIGNVVEVLQRAIQVCLPVASSKQINVELVAEPACPARINAPLLEQAVVNLLDNAIHYSEVGSPIKVSLEKAHSEISIAVQDQGCGIGEQHLPRLFERFYRVDQERSRKSGGTGLGLAIVKHIALAHEGNVSVDSRVGHGSTFRIHLPATTE